MSAHQHQHTQKSWTVLALLAIAQFMVILDVTVVNVALPSIGDALDFSSGQLQWVVSAYVLFTGGLMLLGGRVADLVGRRPVFLTGLGVFTAASLTSGLAWSADALIVSRAVQGFGAAMLLPSALSIITTTYDGHQRSVALGVWGALGSAGAAAGVLFGGIITSALSWSGCSSSTCPSASSSPRSCPASSPPPLPPAATAPGPTCSAPRRSWAGS